MLPPVDKASNVITAPLADGSAQAKAVMNSATRLGRIIRLSGVMKPRRRKMTAEWIVIAR
jgi:hypothetical protein